MERILIAGMILMLSAACHPRISLPPSSQSPHPLAQEESKPSLFSDPELEEFFSQPPPGISEDEAPFASIPILETHKRRGDLQFPISDEPSDDFFLEILSIGGNEKKFDIPIVINEKVEYFLNYFQTTGRKNFSNWLARSGKYIPFMREVLKANGLPEDLVYLAMIESGFNPYAYSRSKALGPWQFIYLTGKRYGLKSNWWVDERRDPEKSTIAAARYLKDLYDMFECWYLAAAGYNAGENKIANGMKRYRTEDFWELTKYRYLKKETKDYVPQMIAAALLAKDPEKYGFVGIDYEEPLQYEKVKVPPGTDLRIIARACDITVEELKELNPELRRWCTPPDVPEYEIKIPSGKADLFLKNFESLRPNGGLTSFKIHRVKRGETLQQIARLYRIDLESILDMNRLDRRSRLQAGMNLLLPLPKEKEPTSTARVSKERGGVSESGEITYTIKKGDTLWSIANEMGVNIGALSAWNNLHPEEKLRPGDRIKIKLIDPSSTSIPHLEKEQGEILYVVQPGDSLWSIANRFKVSLADLRLWNQLDGKDRIHPGDRLKVRLPNPKS